MAESEANKGKLIGIGGVGGSGTRIVAQVLQGAGVNMPRHVNKADDSLHFAFLFGEPEVLQIEDAEFARRFELFETAIQGRALPEFADQIIQSLVEPDDHAPNFVRAQAWRRTQAEALLSSAGPAPAQDTGFWGWKAPVTHIVLPRLATLSHPLKYVHVIRNGLDMAFSRNSRQLRVWGAHLFGLDGSDLSPENLLEYWVKANQRALEIAKEVGGNFYLLNYDRLLEKPDEEIGNLLDFAEIAVSDEDRAKLASLVQSPRSVGRAREHDLSLFPADHINFVRELGFDTYGA